MKTFYYLVAIVIGLEGAFGFWIWKLNENSIVTPTNIGREIPKVKETFQEKFPRNQVLNVETLKLTRSSKELIDPETALPHFDRYPFAEISGLIGYADTCDRIHEPIIQSEGLQKALVWRKFICEEITKLPRNFFERSPFMDISGSSYVALAMTSGRRPFQDEDWLNKNQIGFHILEVLNGVDGRFDFHISSSELRDILDGESFVRTKENILMSSGDRFADGDITYGVYSLRDFMQFLASQPLEITPSNDSVGCLYTEGNVCWQTNPNFQRRVNHFLLGMILSCVLFFAVLLYAILIRRAKQKKIEAEQRYFMLQMLTHEIRTPATSLRLWIEVLRSEFDKLPSESQKAFLSICDEVQRLDRVVNASKQYLNPVSGVIVDKKTDKAKSVKAVVESALRPYADKISWKPFQTDKQIHGDGYWLEVCVKNLVENAIHHGIDPIDVSLLEENGSLQIRVTDQGNVAFSSLQEMMKPFSKGPNSKGLGLGLSIVQKILNEIDGELLYSSNPTTFTIKLKGLHD